MTNAKSTMSRRAIDVVGLAPAPIATHVCLGSTDMPGFNSGRSAVVDVRLAVEDAAETLRKRDRARHYIASEATDVQDASELMLALGLVTPQHDPTKIRTHDNLGRLIPPNHRARYAKVLTGLFLAAGLLAGCSSGQTGSDSHVGPYANPSVSLPATQIIPLTAWTDGGLSNAQVRTVRIAGNCFVQTISGDNGLDMAFTPLLCP